MANQLDPATAVKGAREAVGLSQRQLAGILGIPQPRLSRRESGEVEFRYTELEQVAAALDLTVEQLLHPAEGPAAS